MKISTIKTIKKTTNGKYDKTSHKWMQQIITHI